MNAMTALRRSLSGRQSGSMLLEGLIAVLIFSMGILAIVGMQAAAVKASSDAKYRSDAGLLANQLIGSMWVSNRTVATLQANFNSPNGPSYLTWLADVQAALPGVVAGTQTAPTVVVDAAGIATVTIYWLAPNEPANATPHNYVSVAQIK